MIESKIIITTRVCIGFQWFNDVIFATNITSHVRMRDHNKHQEDGSVPIAVSRAASQPQSQRCYRRSRMRAARGCPWCRASSCAVSVGCPRSRDRWGGASARAGSSSPPPPSVRWSAGWRRGSCARSPPTGAGAPLSCSSPPPPCYDLQRTNERIVFTEKWRTSRAVHFIVWH